MDETTVCLVVTLKIFAKIIAKKLHLKRLNKKEPFKIFVNDTKSIWLILAKSNQINTAEAANYLQRTSLAPKWAVWVYFGTAFSLSRKTGEMVFVDKLTVKRTKEVFYTGVIIQPNLMRESLLTVEEGFVQNSDCDFVDSDAAGFMRSVSKFTYREFISIFKISIQDPSKSNKCEYSNLDELSIYEYIDVIMRYINKIIKFSRMEKISSSSPKNFFEVLSRWKFTTYQKHQLKKILVKLDAKRISTDLVGEISYLKTGHEVILYFSQLLESEAIDWKKN